MRNWDFFFLGGGGGGGGVEGGWISALDWEKWGGGDFIAKIKM